MTVKQTEAVVRAAYDTVADTYADAFRTTEPERPAELGMIEHFASLVTGSRRVLDAGCGAGRMMPVLAGWGCEVEGVDLSPEMVRRARADHGGFNTQVASLNELPFDDDSFDGVFSWYSTIHSPDDDLSRIAREVRRVLCPSGLFLVAFHAGSGRIDVSESYRPHGHEIVLHRFNRTVEQMREVLASSGFREVACLSRAAAEHERNGQAVLIAAAN